MTLKRVIELLKIERECVARGSGKSDSGISCNRDCANCDLVQEDADLLEAYRLAIDTLQHVQTSVERRIFSDGYK